MRYHKHESARPARTPSVAIPEADLISLINDAEDLERSLAALRGAAYGIRHSIDSQELKGDEVEALLVLLSQKLDHHAGLVMDQVADMTQGPRIWG